MPNWIYDRSQQEYCITAEGVVELDVRAGTCVDQETMIRLRDEWTDAQSRIVDDMVTTYDNGRMRLSSFARQMQTEVAIGAVALYMLGKGGRNNMVATDWQNIDRHTRQQTAFLQRFIEDLAGKDLSLAQIRARARQYIESGTALHGQSTSEARGLPRLPQYPGDGSQICKSNCRCSWRYEEGRDEWRCFWELDAGAQHCETCLDNNREWSPLVIGKS